MATAPLFTADAIDSLRLIVDYAAEEAANGRGGGIPTPGPAVEEESDLARAVDLALPAVEAMERGEIEGNALLLHVLDVINASDADHEDFLDSGADTIDLLWQIEPRLKAYLGAEQRPLTVAREAIAPAVDHDAVANRVAVMRLVVAGEKALSGLTAGCGVGFLAPEIAELGKALEPFADHGQPLTAGEWRDHLDPDFVVTLESDLSGQFTLFTPQTDAAREYLDTDPHDAGGWGNVFEGAFATSVDGPALDAVFAGIIAAGLSIEDKRPNIHVCDVVGCDNIPEAGAVCNACLPGLVADADALANEGDYTQAAELRETISKGRDDGAQWFATDSKTPNLDRAREIATVRRDAQNLRAICDERREYHSAELAGLVDRLAAIVEGIN